MMLSMLMTVALLRSMREMFAPEIGQTLTVRFTLAVLFATVSVKLEPIGAVTAAGRFSVKTYAAAAPVGTAVMS